MIVVSYQVFRDSPCLAQVGLEESRLYDGDLDAEALDLMPRASDQASMVGRTAFVILTCPKKSVSNCAFASAIDVSSAPPGQNVASVVHKDI